VFYIALSVLGVLAFANAQASREDIQIDENIDIVDFINSAYTPTFDCPSAELNKSIDEALALPSLSPQQTLQLKSMKSHGLICAGSVDDAENIIKPLLVNENADRSAQYYLSAIFQYGFIYDLKENPQRCDYYVLARDAAKGQFADIHLSASLGYITECVPNDVSGQIYGLFELLETTARMEDPAALAHAYNRVGQFYANRNQNGLAADQYLKGYEVAKDIYTDENLLSLLGSAITALSAANDLEQVRTVLDQYIAINQNVNTAKSNFLQYFFESRYFYTAKEYERLSLSLNKWKKIIEDETNPIYQGLYRWYSAALCYHNENVTCLQDFLESERNAKPSYIAYMKQSVSYAKFLVEVNILLGDRLASEKAFVNYERLMRHIQSMHEDNTGTLDVVKLHVEILNLETTLKEQQHDRNQIIWLSVSILVALMLIVLWFVKRKYSESKSYDSVTGILNNAAVINKLVHLPKPSPKCTNALAIFDIDNFMDVNLSLGSTKSDFVLQQIANTLKKITRNSDLLGRFGPKQFIVCLVDIEEDAAQAFFERSKEALSNTFADQSSHHAISVDSSMSIFYCTEPFDDIDEILKNMLLSLSMKAEQA
jgi:diguanylate cyclase (GGDEF)-like protein